MPKPRLCTGTSSKSSVIYKTREEKSEQGWDGIYLSICTPAQHHHHHQQQQQQQQQQSGPETNIHSFNHVYLAIIINHVEHHGGLPLYLYSDKAPRHVQAATAHHQPSTPCSEFFLQCSYYVAPSMAAQSGQEYNSHFFFFFFPDSRSNENVTCPGCQVK